MKFIRKHKKISQIVLVVLVFLLVFGAVFGKYVLAIVHDFLLETKAFYFESSIMSITGKSYSIRNWDGVNRYTLTVDVSNRKNPEKVTKSDIRYNIAVNCSSNVTCSVNKTTSVIRSTDESDTYQITVTPVSSIDENDNVVVTTTATSTYPYSQTLSATYNIGVQQSMFSYNIDDSENAKYFTLNLTNSISYYEVSEAFGGKSVGDIIGLDAYQELSDADKDKCFSAIVTVTFDPTVVVVDMTNDAYLHRLPTNFQTQTIGSHDYVKKFSFKINAASAKKIMFYKDDPTQNYTYPIINEDSIIDVSVVTADV